MFFIQFSTECIFHEDGSNSERGGGSLHNLTWDRAQKLDISQKKKTQKRINWLQNIVQLFCIISHMDEFIFEQLYIS